MSDDVEVKLGADTSGAEAGFKDAGSTINNVLTDVSKKLDGFGKDAKDTSAKVTESTKTMIEGFAHMQEGVKGSFEGMGKILEGFESKLLLIGSIVAGGKLFKDSVAEVGKSVTEMKQLQNAFGGTSEEATHLNVALKLIGKTSEDYIGVAQKFQRQIKNNSETLNDLGVETRNADGTLKPLTESMQSALGVMMQYEAGADRNAVAMEMFGRNAQEAYGFIKLNDAVMVRAKELMAEYNIENGPEKQAQVKAYRMEQAALKIAFEEVEEKIGEAVLPILVKLGKWFSETGPAAFKAFEIALKVIETAFTNLTAVVLTVYEEIKNFGNMAVTSINAVASAAAAAVKGNFAEARKILADANVQTIADTQATADAVKNIWANAEDSIGKMWSKDEHKESGDDVAPGGHKKAPDFSKGGKDDSLVAKWDAELSVAKNAYSQLKLDQGSFEQYSKEQEAAFWQSKIALTQVGSKDRQEVTKKYYDLEYKIKEEAFLAEIAGMEASKQALKNNVAEKLAITQKEYEMIAKAYGEQSKQAEQAYGKVLAEKQKLADQENAIDNIKSKSVEAKAMHDIDMAKMAIDQEVALGKMSKAQALDAEQKFEDQKYTIKMAGINERLALIDPDKDPESLAKVNAEIEAAEEDHQKKITKIKNDAILESAKYEKQATDGMRGSFETLINDLESGNKKFKDILKDWAASILSTFNKIASQKLAEQLFGAGTSGGGALSSIAGAFTGGGSGLGDLLGGIAGYAVGTPYVPSDQVAMIHKGEAIIPASQNKPGAMGGVTVNFALNTGGAPVDHRTQQQVAAAVGMQMQRAMKRGG